MHRADVHNIEVKWHFCDFCNYKSKQSSSLKKHKAYRHDIEVKWHHCDIDDCNEKFKTKSNLSQHIRTHHTKQYAARRKVQEEKVRTMLVANNFQEWHASDAMPPIGYFKREKRIDFSCADVYASTKYAKIDFVIAIQEGSGYIFLEVDENQHNYGYDASISCDMKRCHK